MLFPYSIHHFFHNQLLLNNTHYKDWGIVYPTTKYTVLQNISRIYFTANAIAVTVFYVKYYIATVILYIIHNY